MKSLRRVEIKSFKSRKHRVIPGTDHPTLSLSVRLIDFIDIVVLVVKD